MKLLDKKKIFFTADLHLFHDKILDFCHRPYAYIDDMHEGFIANWNSVVPEDGHVFILGDLSWGNRDGTVDILKRLNGAKYLIQGNHDYKNLNKSLLDNFIWVKDYKLIKVLDDGNYQKIVLSHYPMKVWDCSHRGSLQLHGHCHGTLKKDLNSRQMDVGVDCNNYTPVSYGVVKARLANIDYKSLDQHIEKIKKEG